LRSPTGGFLRGLVAGALLAVLALALIAPLREAVLPVTSSDRVSEALDVIERSYFEEPDAEALEDASIRGMVRQLRREYEDRFSHYFDPETYRQFRSATSGEFSGVGMTVSEVPRGLRIARVFEDTPAEDAGLSEGNLIVAVDGDSIAGESSTATAARIKGPPGTEVSLTVVDRARERDRRREITVERARVRIPAVEGEMRRRAGHDVAYVQLATFSRGAHGELRDEVQALRRRGAEGLVLDLRGNGGGLLQEAILVASVFQDEGPVAMTEGRTRPPQVLEATGNALDPQPTVVLINGDTASASEIVAATLQQNDLATLIGSRTFGKGSFQEVIELDGAAALDLTVGEYLTSDGTSILGTGVRPDVRVDEEDPDAALDAGLDRLVRQIRAG
jgi:carboxyl-terminal processing protease